MKEHNIAFEQVSDTGLVRAVCDCGGYTSIVVPPAVAERLSRNHVRRWSNRRGGAGCG